MGKSFEKGQKCICPLFELKSFLYCKCILATLLKNRAQYLKIFVLGKVPNVVLLVPPVVWFTMDLKTAHLEDRYHARIIVLLLLYTMKFYVLFSESIFLKNCIFCVLALERQVSFSERYSLISGILQGLAKTCKKYIEVNHFSVLSCSLEN